MNIDWDNWDNEEKNTKLIFNLDNKSYPPFKDLKLNNKVEFIFKNKSYYATIIKKSYQYPYNGEYLTFEFDIFINGHNGLYKPYGKQGHCWNYDRDSDTIYWLINKLSQIKFYI
jgi:hypothetical protein